MLRSDTSLCLKKLSFDFLFVILLYFVDFLPGDCRDIIAIRFVSASLVSCMTAILYVTVRNKVKLS
jgi:hypothetical protein